MRYKNTKTGATIEVECPINGGDWKKVRDRNKDNSKQDPPENNGQESDEE